MFDNKKSGIGLTPAKSGNLAIGLGGFDRIADTNAHEGEWFGIKAINGDAVIASSTCHKHDGLESGDTIKEGDMIYGRFTDITLTSGAILAYKVNSDFLNIE